MKSLLKIALIGLLGMMSIQAMQAQELSCTVSINTDQIQVNEQRGATQIYNEIQSVLQEFMNNRRWTNDNFLPEEKIKCSLNIIITRASANGDYEANARFQVIRPIYGTTYETVILNYVDKSFNFKYLSGTPLYYNDNNYTDNLTHLLAFYSYVALTFDYDTFSKFGGDKYAQKLLNVVNLAQNAGGSWAPSTDVRSRYFLAENLLNQQLLPIREGYYNYHRLALDNFGTNPVEARKQITAYLNTIKQANANKPGQLLSRLIFEAKSPELINIYTDAPSEERKKVSTLLSSLDPLNSDQYRKLTK